MSQIIYVRNNFNENNMDSKIIKIQRNLIMMEFDIEMINKILLYFNIESENQAIDYLTKNSEGLWGHPFIPRLNEEEDNDEITDNKSIDKDKNSSIIGEVKSKIKTIKNRGISNIIYYPMNEQNNGQVTSYCEICGELEKFHVKNNNNIFNNENIIQKSNLIEDSKIDDSSNKNYIDTDNNLDTVNYNYKLKIVHNNNSNNNDNNNNIFNSFDDKIENNKENNNECPICLSEIENKVELEKCHHKYCQECFSYYLMDLINKNSIDNIPCPIKSCNNKNINEEFFSKYLSEEQYFKYRTFRSQNKIARDPKKMFCPICDKYAIIEENLKYKYDPNDPKYVKSTLTCVNGHQFCSCGIALHKGDCYRDTNEFQKFIINEHIKQCPKCGFYIKKIKGCNHMTCGNALCKYEFCWLCMKEAVPGHFEYGQCKGMQFTDPSSFMYQLSRNHPCLYKILVFARCLISLFIILSVIIFIPSVVIIFVSLLFLMSNNNPFKEKLQRLNKYSKTLLILTLSCIIFSLQSVLHLMLALIIANFLIFLTFSILFKCIRILYEMFKCLIDKIKRII